MLTINDKAFSYPRGGHILQQWLTGTRLLVRILVLVVLLVPGLVHANTDCRGGDIILDRSTASVPELGGCLWYREDPEQSLVLDDLRAGPEKMIRHDGGVLNFGYTDSAYWTRFNLSTRRLDARSDWVLELALPLVDDVRLYLVRDGQLVEQRQTGYQESWERRDLSVPNPTFRLSLPPDSVTTVYLRITNTNTFRLPVTLWHPDTYIEKVSIDELVRGMLLGAILAILAYNLFVAVSVRERSNIYYVLYLVCAAVFIGTEQVHGVQLLDSRPAILNKAYLHYQIVLTWFFGLLMARSLLETRQRSPDLDQTLRLCLFSVVATFVLSLFMPYAVAMEWVVMGSMLLSVILIVVSYLSWRYYNPAARSYFFAWTLALTGFGIYALTVMGYLPLNTFTSYSPQIGLTAQIILFSFSLADRIKQVQGEALAWNQKALANLSRYQSLFDNAVEGVFQMSPDRRFLTANPAMAELLGFDNSQQLLNEDPDVLETCIADHQLRRSVISQLETKGTIKGFEVRYLSRQGNERWAIISLHTVYDAEGEPTHLEGTCIDSTESHQRLQVEREREQERLEKELARNSARAKSQFLANMSHEIRTPLAAIIGYGETLLEPGLNEAEKRSSAETVVRSGRHLLELVNDILDHSKIDANKLDVDVVQVNLPELLDEIRAFFAPRAREKGLEFEIICDYPLPERIQTDPTRYRQIIINLCGNALKFTEQGTISLVVRCDSERETLYTRVVDTGIGMKPEQQQRLFDPFAQGSNAIARQYGGTGLGLSISRRLAELLGGDIRVTSTYGEGSEFEVTIGTGSLGGVHFLRDASEFCRRSNSLPVVPAPRLRGRILCAEDNDLNRRLVSLLVGKTGAGLVHVANGAEALERASREAFDLILMDIQMPVMNGRDATRALREAGVNTPIIALTANVMTEDIAEYRLAGCNDHLAKPIDRERFYAVLSRYLSTGADRTGRHRGSVLVAEDNDDNRRLVERMLRRTGVEPVLVADGEEAVRRALSDSIHLVLMDRHMPRMDGVAATRLLRQAGFRRPIVAFTAGDQQETEELMAAGCEAVLNKPIDSSHLDTLLSRYLPLSSAEPEPEEDNIDALVTSFLEGLGERRRLMNRAWQQQDLASLLAECHQIKGTAGAMGYPAMTEQAAVLERCLRNTGEPDATISRELERLHSIIDRAIDDDQSIQAAPQGKTNEQQ